jgi:hypothetical protein
MGTKDGLRVAEALSGKCVYLSSSSCPASVLTSFGPVKDAQLVAGIAALYPPKHACPVKDAQLQPLLASFGSREYRVRLHSAPPNPRYLVSMLAVANIGCVCPR